MPRFFAWFNQHFGRATDRYVAGVSSMLSRPKRWLAVTLMVFAVTGALFTQLPGGFLPEEDQGYYLISYDAPAGATTQRTDKSVRIAEAALAKDPAVRDMVSVTGFNFFGQGQSAAISFAVLKPYDQRSPLSLEESMTKLYEAVIRLPDATVFPLNPPAISALGNATGFTMKIEDRGGNDAAGLERATNAILAAAAKNPKLTGMRLEGQPRRRSSSSISIGFRLELSVSRLPTSMRRCRSRSAPPTPTTFPTKGRCSGSICNRMQSIA